MRVMKKKIVGAMSALLMAAMLLVPVNVAHAAELSYGLEWGDVSVNITGYLGERTLAPSDWEDLHSYLYLGEYYVGPISEVEDDEHTVFLLSEDAAFTLSGHDVDGIALHQSEVFRIEVTRSESGRLYFEQVDASYIDVDGTNRFSETGGDSHTYLYVLRISHSNYADDSGAWFVLPLIFNDSANSVFEFVDAVASSDGEEVHTAMGEDSDSALVEQLEEGDTPLAGLGGSQGIPMEIYIIGAGILAVLLVAGAGIVVKKKSRS